MKADCGAVWIPFHTCSNQTEVALQFHLVLARKELYDSISSDLGSCNNSIENVIRLTLSYITQYVIYIELC